MLSDLIASGAMHSLKSMFMAKKEKNTIIDPFSCLVKLALLKFMDQGTKISVHDNRIYFNSPNYIQGVIRFIYGDG
jgi:adenosine deaminase